MPFVGTVMLEHHCANKRKNIKNTRLHSRNSVKTKKNSEKRQIVGAAGIPARSIASSRNLLSILLQCRRQECPRLLQFALSIIDFSSNSYF